MFKNKYDFKSRLRILKGGKISLILGAFVKTFNLENYTMNYEGNVSSKFINAEPFSWLKPKEEEK